jgi:hypothetical protein
MSLGADELALHQPPSYNEATDLENELMQPVIFLLNKQTIHAESLDSPPLYQLNRGVATLSHATEQVELARVERRVKTHDNGNPVIKPRERSIFTLHCMKNMPGGLEPLPPDSPQYWIRPASRKTIGAIGLKKALLRSRWKALPVDLSGKKSEFGLQQFVQGAYPIFELVQKGGRYQWTDSEGKPVAVEDEGENEHRLLISKPLRRQAMDALVALWCCRLWNYSANHQEKVHEGTARRKLTICRGTIVVIC